MTKRIGLTGGIASGKSTVSAYLRTKGIPVVDADLVARQIVQPKTETLLKIVQTFGVQYLLPDGALDRKRFGEMVFQNPTALSQLNAITKPVLVSELQRRLDTILEVPLVVLDAALLLEEACYRELVEEVWVVVTAPDLQMERLMMRNGYDLEQAQARISAQMTDTERLRYADAVIDNSGTLEETYQQIEDLLTQKLGEMCV